MNKQPMQNHALFSSMEKTQEALTTLEYQAADINLEVCSGSWALWRKVLVVLEEAGSRPIAFY